MHISYWKLAQHILGPSIGKNLELFAAISLQNIFSFSKFRRITVPKQIVETPGIQEKCAHSDLDWSKVLNELTKNTITRVRRGRLWPTQSPPGANYH